MPILTSGDGGAGRKLWDDLRHFTPINYAIQSRSRSYVKTTSKRCQRRLQDQVEAARRRDGKKPDRTPRQSHRRELQADALQRGKHRRTSFTRRHRCPQKGPQVVQSLLGRRKLPRRRSRSWIGQSAIAVVCPGEIAQPPRFIGAHLTLRLSVKCGEP